MRRRPLAMAWLCLLTLSFGTNLAHSATAGGWQAPIAMVQRHQNGAAVSLLDGRAMVLGGLHNTYDAANDTWKSEVSAAVEIFDPASGVWTEAASFPEPRHYHSATVLSDGRVLVVGGSTFVGCCTEEKRTAFLYDPTSDSWKTVAPSNEPHLGHSAVALDDGRVLLVDQFYNEIYDPATDVWTNVPTSPVHFQYFQSIRLHDGRVLAAAGCTAPDYQRQSEIFDPTTSTWTAQLMNAPHCWGRLAMLPDGRVLAAGGFDWEATDHEQTASEIFDPATNHWTPTAPMNTPHSSFALTTMSDGSILAAGGFFYWNEPKAEIFDPTTGQWWSVPDMTVPRWQGIGLPLPDGSILVTGGDVPLGPDDNGTSEVFRPDTSSVARVRFTSKPSGFTMSTEATIRFEGSVGATLQCSLDGVEVTPCSSPTHVGPLPDGPHTFTVAASNASGPGDRISANWIVDTVPPETTILSGPPRFTNGEQSSFAFASNEIGARFECSIQHGAWETCSSPKTYSLEDGDYAFSVRAIDEAGNVDATPATARWTVDTKAPESALVSPQASTLYVGGLVAEHIPTEDTILVAPGDGFVLEATGHDLNGPAKLSILVDGQPLCSKDTNDLACAWSPAPSLGKHTITVTAVDPAGNAAPVVSMTVTVLG
jgi:hypothetical protein